MPLIAGLSAVGALYFDEERVVGVACLQFIHILQRRVDLKSDFAHSLATVLFTK